MSVLCSGGRMVDSLMWRGDSPSLFRAGCVAGRACTSCVANMASRACVAAMMCGSQAANQRQRAANNASDLSSRACERETETDTERETSAVKQKRRSYMQQERKATTQHASGKSLMRHVGLMTARHWHLMSCTKHTHNDTYAPDTAKHTNTPVSRRLAVSDSCTPRAPAPSTARP